MPTQTAKCSPLRPECDCLICFAEIQAVYQLPNCRNHFFCQACVQQYIKFQLTRQGDIPCPGGNCGAVFSVEDIRCVFGNERCAEFKTDAEGTDSPNFKMCPQLDCPGVLSKPDSQANYKAKCPACRLKICYFCLERWHQPLTCKQYRDHQLDGKVRVKLTKECPCCKRVIEKNEKSDLMTCIACRHKWCWQCLQDGFESHFLNSKCANIDRVRVEPKRKRQPCPPPLIARFFPIPESIYGRFLYLFASLFVFLLLFPLISIAAGVGVTYTSVRSVVSQERIMEKKVILTVWLTVLFGSVFVALCPIIAVVLYCRYLWTYVCQ